MLGVSSVVQLQHWVSKKKTNKKENNFTSWKCS